jgi:hypothetical protein
VRTLLILFCAALLLTSCSFASRNDDSVQGQLKSNQAVLLTIQNQADLSDLYFYYTGDQGETQGTAKEASSQGVVRIGELNVMLHNIGGSVTAGAVYVHGYDPNLISIKSKGGKPISTSDEPACNADINIVGTGEYQVQVICENNDEAAWGAEVTDDGVVGTVFHADRLADKIASYIGGKDTTFFTKLGIFDNSRVDCGVHDGKFGCALNFGSTAFDPNRASYGYRLINLFAWELKDPAPRNGRIFPPDVIEQGNILHGASDEYPLGDALYYDYYIDLNRAAWAPLLNDAKQTIQVTACYFYTDTVTPSVCVDPDPTTRGNEPCSMAPIEFKEPQGGPVKVTRIEQRSQPGGTAFTIYVEHIGGGQLWAPGAFLSCNPNTVSRPDRRYMDVVQLLDARILGQTEQLRCLPSSSDTERLVRLKDGKGQITCVYPVPVDAGRQSFTSAITLEFGYVYQNTVRKDVIIHRT